VGLLSGGQRQALALVMAVLRTPDVLLLDEHTAALDPRTAALVLAATVHVIARDRLTAVMVTHNMNQALSCGSMIVMMENGRIKLTLAGDAKRNATVPDLVARFGEADDKILLAR
jgi:putative ABC transport system ATP-binding protein